MSTEREINQKAHELSYAQDQYLRANGWKYVCDTPGSYWRWSKKLADGRTILVDVDQAVRFQACIAEDPQRWEPKE